MLIPCAGNRRYLVFLKRLAPGTLHPGEHFSLGFKQEVKESEEKCPDPDNVLPSPENVALTPHQKPAISHDEARAFDAVEEQRWALAEIEAANSGEQDQEEIRLDCHRHLDSLFEPEYILDQLSEPDIPFGSDPAEHNRQLARWEAARTDAGASAQSVPDAAEKKNSSSPSEDMDRWRVRIVEDAPWAPVGWATGTIDRQYDYDNDRFRH